MLRPTVFCFQLLILNLFSGAQAQVISYEGARGTFPEDQGWERSVYCGPVRTMEGGWLVQHVRTGLCFPGVGDRDLYTVRYPELAGAATFFIEWESQSDGPASEIPWVAPSAIVASSYLGSIDNHFTIASDQVRYIRDVDDIPHVYMDITPGEPHVYRLEYQNEPAPGWYEWSIDGVTADEGVPEGRFPSQNPAFYGITVLGAWSVENDSTTRWRYVRLGEIPIAGSLDFTNDGLVDLDDYFLFRDYLTTSGPDLPHAPGWECGDGDGDGDFDLLDFAVMQSAFTGGE